MINDNNRPINHTSRRISKTKGRIIDISELVVEAKASRQTDINNTRWAGPISERIKDPLIKHEALDRANLALDFINTCFDQHPYILSDENLYVKFYIARAFLGELYCDIGNLAYGKSEAVDKDSGTT